MILTDQKKKKMPKNQNCLFNYKSSYKCIVKNCKSSRKTSDDGIALFKYN